MIQETSWRAKEPEINEMLLPRCIHKDLPCCFKTEKTGRCKILRDTHFWDDICHFRKLSVFGKNMYDELRRKEKENKSPG